jgi:hypothetical protein
MEVFDPSINPVFKTAQARFFLAYMNGEIVGRVAAMINWIEGERAKNKENALWLDGFHRQQRSF